MRWTFVSFCFFAVMLYSACIDTLKWFGVANIDFYDIKVIKDEREQKVQPFGALIFIATLVGALWIICGFYKQEEVYYVCNTLFGYLLYRIWAYMGALKSSLAMKCFPFSNFSSVTVFFLFTALSEAA